MLCAGSRRFLTPSRSAVSLGQHHHAAHAGRARRQRLPLRFLVRQRGKQAPVDAGARLRRVEDRAVLWQNGAQALDEMHAVAWRQPVDVAKVAVLQAIHLAAGGEALEEVVGATDEVGIDVGAEQPDDRPRRADLQRRLQFRIEVAADVELGVVDDCGFVALRRDALQQIHLVAAGEGGDDETRDLALHLAQRPFLARSGDDMDCLVRELLDFRQRQRRFVGDEDMMALEIKSARAQRRVVDRRLPRRGKMRLPVLQAVEDLGVVGGDDETRLEREILREHASQFVVETALALFIDRVSRDAGPGQDDQLFRLLERPLHIFAATEKKNRKN